MEHPTGRRPSYKVAECTPMKSTIVLSFAASVALLACSPPVTTPPEDASRLDGAVSDSTSMVPEVSCPAGETVCTSGALMACVDLRADPLNCGACGTVCEMGQICASGACACRAGRTACGGACVDTQTDSANCGMCGRACPSGQSCASGACACPMGQMACGAACVNVQVDPSNCGMCGRACAATESCSAGACSSVCGRGTTSCGGMCINPQTDSTHCGSCGNACGASRSCVMGRCVPPNDTRAAAATLMLTDGETTVMGNTDGATHDGPSVGCSCTSGADVWYRFTLAREELVYFDTAGSSFDTSLVVTDATGVPVSAQVSLGSAQRGLCNDDSACPMAGGFTNANQSRTWGRLAAGTYYVVVGGCTAGAFVLHAQHLRIDAGTSFAGYIAAGVGGVSGQLPFRSTTNGSCATPSVSSPSTGEEFRMFVTCGGTQQLFSVCASDGGTYERSQGLTSFDPVLFVRSAATNAELACNDDGMTMGAIDCRGTGGDMAQFGARLGSVATARGMHAIFVDSRTGGDATIVQMDYTMRYAVRNAP
ncbi:MAG: hypothetical protein JNK05_36630 [Myxococcales bacterium]|nr:hypothetical protein [Myxococcales bacterium]